MQEQNQTYDTVYPAITDVASELHTTLALVYGDSTKDTYSALAFQVVRGERRVERVDGFLSLNDNATQTFGYLGENGFSATTANPGTGVFGIDNKRDQYIAEYGFAIPIDGIYIGVQTGDGDSISGSPDGSDRERGFGPDDLVDQGVLSDHTYVRAPSISNDDPMPTTALAPRADQGLIRIDSQQDGPNPFRFAFNNQSGAQQDIDIIGKANVYNVRPIRDGQTVRRLVNGEADRTLQYGGFGNSNPNLPSAWYDYSVDIGPDELLPGQGA